MQRRSRSAPALSFDIANFESLEARLLWTTTPNDTYFNYEWGLQATAATQAWDTTTGSSSVVVADIDTGLDYTHPDLYENVWINQAEIPKSLKAKLRDVDGDGIITFYDLNSSRNRNYVHDLNANGYIDAGDLLARRNANGSGGWSDGIDGDANGYVDDIIGWDFANNDNNPIDTVGHGTHTAGIIGAQGNNGIGVSGVNWKTSLMALKIFDDKGNSVSDTTIAAAIRYSADMGARVSNNSWGGYGGTNGDAIYSAIEYAGDKGQLFVTAAGNDGLNDDRSIYRSYPASFDLPNIITVAATNQFGGLAYFSNYGRTSVDLGAPGTNVLSTYLNGSYAFMSGTSMATPFVTGALALTLSTNPSMSAGQLKTSLLGGVDRAWPLTIATVSGGELNLVNIVLARTTSAITQDLDNPQAPPPVRVAVFNYMDGTQSLASSYSRAGTGTPFASQKLIKTPKATSTT